MCGGVWWRCKARGVRWRCEVEVWRCGGVRWREGSPARRRAACRAGMTWRLTSDEPRRFATRDSPYRAAPRCVARELGPRNSEPATSHFAFGTWQVEELAPAEAEAEADVEGGLVSMAG